MGVPTAGDFNKWDGTKFTNTDWDQNVDKTVEILANGNYDLNVNKVTASEYVGIPSDQFSTLTAGENLSAGNIVRVSGGQVYKADNTSSAGVTSIVGVCNTTVSSGGTVKVDYGFYNGFSSLTAGTMYYVGTSGAITSTRPTGAYVVEVGRAVSTTRINLEFNNLRPEFSGLINLLSAAGAGVFGFKIFTFQISMGSSQKKKIFEGNTGNNRLGMFVIAAQYGSPSYNFGGVNYVEINNSASSYVVTNIIPDSFFAVGIQGTDVYASVPGGGNFTFQITLIINGRYIDGLIEPSQMSVI
jgi:hypothetical protein